MDILGACDAKRLEAFHMCCRCQILRIRWFDDVSNVEVTACTQLLPITDTIARRLLGLFGHVAHMNNGIPARDALARHTEVRPPDGWKRALGWPHQVWVQQIDDDSVSAIRHTLRHVTGRGYATRLVLWASDVYTV